MHMFEPLNTLSECHPIDVVQTVAQQKSWIFDRTDSNQITMTIEGQWRHYTLTLAWAEHEEDLQLLCSFEMTPPEIHETRLYELLNMINAKCWTGSFSWHPQMNIIVYRYGLTLAGGQMAATDQVNTLVQTAVKSCELYYPAFQLVTWGERCAQEALDIASLDPSGHA